MSQACIDFIGKLLTMDKNLRYSAEEALEDPWILEHFKNNNEESGLAT